MKLPSQSMHLEKPFKVKVGALALTSAVVGLSAFGLVNLSFAAGVAANALPTNGKVVAGAATIASSGNTMNINQSTQRAVINWDSFNVGANSTVNFNQPNANASTLNRVIGTSKSMINGAINAPGEVIFVNANGVIFGKGADVNAGSIVATTMDVANSAYMAGGNQTYRGGETGKVVNHGKLTSNSLTGYIALMAPEVRNEGVMVATMSGANTVALVSGSQVTLSFSNNSLRTITVDASVVKSLIANKRLIQVDGGHIIIAANSASDLKASVINNGGAVVANSVVDNGGSIELVAATVNQNGTVSANSAQAAGGNVAISGKNITLVSGSATTATGATGGGNITVGVNSAALNTNQNINSNNGLANLVDVQANSTVDASATQNGNGGTISIWSQVKTIVAGTLKSMGGLLSGNGGVIETSSKGTVQISPTAIVDTTAPHGKTGNWITDPLSITVDGTTASTISNALNTTNVTLDATATACGAFGACASSQTPSITFLLGADIYSANTNTALNLIANGGNININSNITAGTVTAVAQAINVNGSINTNGGSNSNTYLAGAVINILGNINSNGNNQNNSNSNSLNSANTITASNRRNMSGGNNQNTLTADQNNYTSNGGMINILATGDINIGANSYISANGINGGAVNIVSTAGTVTNNGIVDSLGKQGTGGFIAIVGKTQTDLIGALISSEGLAAGGIINLGQINNLGNGSTLAPPATAPPALSSFVSNAAANAVDSNNSIISSGTSLDSQTGVNAPNGNIVVFGDKVLVNNSSLSAIGGSIAIGRTSFGQGELSSIVVLQNSNFAAHNLETSGHALSTSGNTINAQTWLLDPNNVTITNGGSTSLGCTAANINTCGTGQNVNISNTDLQSAVNTASNGAVIEIQTSGNVSFGAGATLTFNVASANAFVTLKFNGVWGSASTSTTLGAITDNTTASGSGVNLAVLTNGGAITTSGAISVKGSITLDNTYAGSPASNVSGSLAPANATTSAGITINNALTAGNISNATNGVLLNGYSNTNFAITAT
ncbi:filamentous hemagglutinin N-terminal domain-containing protein, partial [Polynucleobacter sp. MWH-Berg-3C6]|uniref:beta strand repeat-containing protein n=1 Tax=Polynucleobacter sp. MWH-Berg-3C6 TaxID=1855882 RepID=UPI001C0DA4F6